MGLVLRATSFLIGWNGSFFLYRVRVAGTALLCLLLHSGCELIWFDILTFSTPVFNLPCVLPSCTRKFELSVAFICHFQRLHHL